MKIKKPKNISKMKIESVRNRVSMMDALTEKVKRDVENAHVSISQSNRKTGMLSVSLIPIRCCGNCHGCKQLCYDIRNVCYTYNTWLSRATNVAILELDRDRYFKEIEAYVMGTRFFRWHIGGDVVDADYLQRIIDMAFRNPWCEMLIFTKMYGLVNNWCNKNGVEKLPGNLHLLFSAWPGEPMENPYNFPITSPLFADGTTAVHDGAKLCTGLCIDCAKEHRLCFAATWGDEIVFPAH